MIVKRLRGKNNWSQEQLADFSGLNVRTIQRVESGQKASLETLKSLASVFEVDISKLTEEITVIDKESEHWINLPWWFRVNMIGVNTHRHVLGQQKCLVNFGVRVKCQSEPEGEQRKLIRNSLAARRGDL